MALRRFDFADEVSRGRAAAVVQKLVHAPDAKGHGRYDCSALGLGGSTSRALPPFDAVTGSVGKTTTRQMIRPCSVAAEGAF